MHVKIQTDKVIKYSMPGFSKKVVLNNSLVTFKIYKLKTLRKVVQNVCIRFLEKVFDWGDFKHQTVPHYCCSEEFMVIF